MSKYIILYRDKTDEFGECKYIKLNSDGTIHLDIAYKPIVSNAKCITRIYENFDDVETWLTEDVFNRMKNTDGSDTFSDVADMIKHGEHEEFEAYIRESEIEKMCEDYALDEQDVKEILNNYNNDYFDMSIITNVWKGVYEVAENYIDEYCDFDSFVTKYIDYDGLGEEIVNDGYYYELADGRVVEYSY